MLAYVFSHRPAAGVDIGEYEAVLREFHRHLAGATLAGFVSSSTYRTGDGYADWYLLENSAALDVLNEAAVTGARESPHRAVARMAVNGAGKLLSLAAGEHVAGARVETRFEKPPGMAYPQLYAALQPLTAGGAAGLWRRMMVLGPPPEFCITSRAGIELPLAARAEVVARTPI